ncbi:hypothetical protein BASA83_002956 [Batrachochytrium salamandrivorans]|nr:hypothetical protein BASA83_002956 [Batrachochytrium salamandrivorans]
MGKAYYGHELGWWQQVTPCTTADNNQQGYPAVHWLPDSRLPLDPFWLKLGLGHFSLAHWSHGAVGKIPALVLVSSDQTAVQEQILADTTSQTKDSQATTLVCSDETLQTCGDSASLQKYVTRQFLDTSGFFKDPSFD